MQKYLRYFVPAALKGFRPWLIAAIVLLSLGLSFGLTLTQKCLPGLKREAGALTIISKGTQPQEVLSLRRPDGGATFYFQPADLVAQVEAIETYEAYDAYLERQDQIMRIMDAPSVIVGVGSPSGKTDIQVAVSTVEFLTLGEGFWGPLIVGLIAFVIGGWVWCLKPHQSVTQILALNGFGMLLSAVSGAVNYVQPLALPSDFIVITLLINHLGTILFGLSLVAIFLLFPKPLINERKLWLLLGLSPLLLIVDQLRLLGTPAAVFYFCFGVIIAVLCLAGFQVYRTKGNPLERAALTWLGLAVVSGVVTWGVIIAIYVIAGQFLHMPASYMFVPFVILYIGIAVGVTRFRLFEVADWGYRIFFYTMAALLFVLLDAGLIYLVGLAQSSAIAIALVITAFGYLPLRDLLWRRFIRGRSLNESEVLDEVLDMAFAAEAHERQAKWQTLLKTLFAPKEIAPSPHSVAAAFIDGEGLCLHVPELMDTPALMLSFPHGGRGLFSPKHLRLLNQIIRLSRKTLQGLDAYERGAAEQRHRLAQDLHDDVGAKLVSGLTVADAASRPFIYGALNDIREIATALTTQSAPLDRVIADMRHEAVRRLDAAGVALDWPLWPEDAPFILIAPLHRKALASAMREIITNGIKHSDSTSVQVNLSLRENWLVCRVEDDGRGFPPDVMDGSAAGQGLKSLTDRIAQLKGKVRFENLSAGRHGALVAFEYPLTFIALEGNRL